MFEQTLIVVFFWMLVGHAIGDFGLQTDWMASNKSPKRHTRADAQRRDLIWIHVLTAHALVHAGAVALATGMVWLGIAEFVAHCFIDYGKSTGKFGFHVDQFLHLGCKVVWAACWFVA